VAETSRAAGSAQGTYDGVRASLAIRADLTLDISGVDSRVVDAIAAGETEAIAEARSDRRAMALATLR
jgi:hypothetical protein